jgi:hypothetical protein
MEFLAVTRYVSPRLRPLTPSEAQIRAIAYALKEADPQAIAAAAPAMAALIRGPCWLVPIPASDTSLKANLALAEAVATLVPGARVVTALARTHPVASSTDRRRRGLSGLAASEHHFVRIGPPMDGLPLYFVDNVVTTGNTIRAARAALGRGTGLVYGDAGSPFKQHLALMSSNPPAFQPNPTNMKTQTTPTRTDNQPVHKIRYGAMTASIWRQEGEKGPMFNVSFQRSYKEGQTWKTSTSFGRSDLLVLSLMATEAFQWIGAQQPEGPRQ